MPRRIPVGPSPHYYAIVDDEDYEWLSGFTWVVRDTPRHHTVYATVSRSSETNANKAMHTLITGFAKTDHINGIGLDNRRENLRDGSGGVNEVNRTADSHYRGQAPTSKYKGVSWHKSVKKWTARTTVDQKTINLGVFDTEEDAAIAYDNAIRNLRGDSARFNFPREGERSAFGRFCLKPL